MYETAVYTIVIHVFAKHGKQFRIESTWFHEVDSYGPCDYCKIILHGTWFHEVDSYGPCDYCKIILHDTRWNPGSQSPTVDHTVKSNGIGTFLLYLGNKPTSRPNHSWGTVGAETSFSHFMALL